MWAMTDTRATTIEGVMRKLDRIQLELRDGDSGFGEAIVVSAILDLGWINRKR